MRILIFVLTTLLVQSAFAASKLSGHVLLSVGGTADRVENQGYEVLGQNGIVAGFSKNSWGLRFEGLKSESNQTEGNFSLKQTRHLLSLSALYSSPLPTKIGLEGFLGAGLGALQDTVEMQIGSDSGRAVSEWSSLGQLLLGIRLLELKPVALELEARIWASPKLENNPATSAMARFGFYF